MLESHARVPVRPSSGLPARRAMSLKSPASARSYRQSLNKGKARDDFDSPQSNPSPASDTKGITPTLPPRPGTSLGNRVCTPEVLRPQSAYSAARASWKQTASDATGEDAVAWSPSDQYAGDPEDQHQDHSHLYLQPRDDDQDASSVAASDGAEVGAESPNSAKTPTKQSERRVTFIEAPAPQGSAQAAAKFNRQRQRSQVMTTLRRADQLTPRSTWTQSVSPQATPRDAAALQETRTRAFPPLAELLQTAELDPVAKEDVKSHHDTQVTPRKHQSMVGEEGLDPHLQALPKHVKSLWSIYHPTEELCDESHGGLVQALAGGHNLDVDHNLAELELQRIKTGEDAIAFFATHGDSTDVKVMYARRAEVGITEFRPYDLVLVSEKERGSEFFMISAKGVVHICPGRLSEHTTLSDWMHQTMIFSVLTSMTFFRHYIASKSFSNWRMSARHLAYSALRTRLSRRLFLGKPIFVEAQARIHSLLYSVGATRLIALDATGRALELQPFLTHQKELCAMSEFEAKADAVTEVVDAVLDTISNAGRIEQETDHKPKKLKGRSVAAERKESQLRVHRRRLQEFNVSLLGNFVRVVDVMLLSRLVDLVVSQAAELLDRLEKSPKIFSVSINFRETKENMEFSPDRQGFVQGFSEVLAQAVELVGSVAPLATSRKYDDHFRHQHVSPSRASDVIRKNLKFQATQQAIMGRVELDFAKAQREADEYYGPYRKIYDYGHAWDQESFDARQLTHIELADEMSLMKRYEEELDKLKSVHVSGFLLIQARTLRDTLVPVVEGGLQMMKSRLRCLARDSCKLAYEQFDHVNRDLQQRPPRLEQFAEYVRSYRWTQARWQELDGMKNSVEEMYSMIRQYGIRVEMNEEVTKEALNQKVVMLELTTWPEASAFVEDLLKSRTEEVMQRITAIEAEALSMKGEFKAGVFADVESIDEPMKVIEKLEQMEERLGDLAQNATWLNTCFELFLQTPFRMKSLNEAVEAHEKQMQLWEIALQWSRTSTAWFALHPQGLDIFPMRGKLEGFHDALEEMVTLLPQDDIVAELQTRINAFQAMLPALMHLANPALGSSHWSEILDPLHIAALPTEVTIKMLSTAGLFASDFQQDLSAISAGASAEAGLLSLVEGVVLNWDEQEMALSCVASDIDLWILADQTEVLDYLESDLTALQVVLSSPHLTESIEAHTKEWQKKLLRAKETLQLWLSIQEQYVLLVSFFEDQQQWDHRSLTALAPVQDHYKPADRLWRQLLSRARTNFRTVMAVTSQAALPTQLKKLSQDLDLAESRLHDFLDLQRRTCPRLHLIDDHQLLVALATAARHGMASATKAFASQFFPCSVGLQIVSSARSSIEVLADSQIESVVIELLSEEGGALTLKAQPMEPPHLSEWLQVLSVNCQKALKDAAQAAMSRTVHLSPADIIHRWLESKSSSEDKQFPSSLPGQIVLLVLAIHWAHAVESVLPRRRPSKEAGAAQSPKRHRASILCEPASTIKNILESYSSDMQKIIKLLRWNPQSKCIQRPAHRAVVGAALLQVLRNHHVLELLATQRDTPPLSSSFEWQRYLRMQWDVESKRASARLLDWSVDYGYEYVGTSPRLVITPETERNYIGLVGGLRSQAAMAIAGPSGAGKAELVRELARFVATPLLEVSCAAASETTWAVRVFRGLASLGAWGLFHMSFASESIAVLASFAQTLQIVSEQRRAGLSTLELDTVLVTMDQRHPPEAFIVLRGSSNSRPPLDLERCPVGFHSLIRPLALAMPSLTAVAEALLLVEGFANESKRLAKKILCFFESLAAQLPSASQTALASTLGICRASQLAGRQLRSQTSALPSADAAVLEALATVSYSTRGTASNDPAWETLLTGIFRESTEGSLSEQRYELCEQLQLHLVEHGALASIETANATEGRDTQSKDGLHPLSLRALDIHQQLCHGHAIVVTGGALNGKSAVLSAVAAVGLQDHGNDEVADAEDDRKSQSSPEHIQLIRFFPAALSSAEWSGSSEGIRGSSRGGLLLSFLQSFAGSLPLTLPSAGAAAEESDTRHLVVLDAELDASWADELCPALLPMELEGAEKQRQIYFGGNERVLVPPTVSFAFETQGLAGASPAFCARTSICPLGGVLTIAHVLDQFSERLKASGKLHEKLAHQIMLWLRRFLDAGVLSVLRSAMQAQPCSKESIDQMDLEHASRMLNFLQAILCDAPNELDEVVAAEKPRELVEASVIYAIAWGLGGGLDASGRKDLGTFLIQALEAQDGLPSGLALLNPIIQSAENLWKFQIVSDDAGVRCMPTKDWLLGLSPLRDAPELLATEETEAVRAVCNQLAMGNCGFFLCGPRLSGKSAAAERIMHHSLDIGWGSLLFRCPLGASGSTFSSYFRSNLEHQPVMSLGPSTGGHCIAMIDDVHLASGTLPERLREIINLGGFNDSNTQSFFSVQRVQFGVIGSPSLLRRASAVEVSGLRFLRHFQPVQLQEPGVDSMNHIFTSLFESWTSYLAPDMRENVNHVIEGMLTLLPLLQRELPMHPHRIFAACHLFDVFQFCRGLRLGVPNSAMTLDRLVFHELSRQFHDRLRMAADREVFSKALIQAGIPTPNGPEPLFANMLATEANVDLYTDLGGPESACEVMTEALETTLQSFHMPVVLFSELVVSVVGVARSLALHDARHTGLTFVLGSPGSGKRTCGHLGAHLARCHVSKPQAFDGRALAEELKAIAKKTHAADAFSEQRPLVFGPVMDSLLDPDRGGREFLKELDAAVRGADECMPDMSGEAAAMDAGSKFHRAGFQNMAVLLCLSPEHGSEPLRDIVRMYPGLSACSGVVWLQPWSKSACVEVAESILLTEDQVMAARGTVFQYEQDMWMKLALASAHLLDAVPTTTSRLCHPCVQHAQEASGESQRSDHYARFIASLVLVRERQTARYEELIREKSQLESALAVLTGSQEMASSLADRYDAISKRITKEDQMIKIAERSCSEMKPELDEAHRLTQEQEKRLTYLKDEVVDHEANIDVLFETALPALQQAHDDLQGLSKASILECRLVDVPSEPLAMVIWPVMTALGRDAEWREVEALLGEKDSIAKMIALDPKKLSQEQIDKMEDVVGWSMWGQELDDDAIPGVAFGRCCVKFVPALLAAAHKWEELRPQRNAYEEHCRKTEAFEITVKTVRDSLAAVEKRLSDKQKEAEEHKQLLAAAQEELVKLTPEAHNHQQIVDATDEEVKAWRMRRQELKENELHALPGNLLLGAFLVHFAGCIPAEQQNDLLDEWQGICKQHGVRVSADAGAEELLRYLGDSDEVQVTDTLASLCAPRSVSMCVKSLITPLLFDPFGIVKPWLQQYCERTKDLFLMHLRTSDSPTALLENVKNAARKHMLLLLEVTDGYVPPVLEQILHGDIPVNLGNHGYRRVFLLSKHRMRSTPTVAHFTFDQTTRGLENLLLDEILRLEVPDVKLKLAETRLIYEKASSEAVRMRTKILETCSGPMNDRGDAAVAGEKDMDVLLCEVRRLKSCKVDAEGRCAAAASEVERAETIVAKWRLVAEVGVALYVSLLDAEKWHSIYYCNWNQFQQWFYKAFQEAMTKVSHPVSGNAQDARIVAFTKGAPVDFLEVMAPEFLPIHRPIFAFSVAVRLAGAKRGLDHTLVAQLFDIVCADEAALSQLDLPETGEDDCSACPETMEPVAWHRLRACAVLCPVFQQVLNHIHKHPGSWTWVERANMTTDSGHEVHYSSGLSVPKIDLPHLKRHVHDLDELHELFIIMALVRRLAVPALRHYVAVELGQAAVRAIGDDHVPHDQFNAGVRAMGAPRVLIALSEKRPGVDSRVDLERWLTTLAAEEGVPLSVLSGAADGFLERAARELARRQQYHGWLLILDVKECTQLARLWELISSSVDENAGEMENTSSFLLVLSVHISPAVSAENLRIPPSLLSCTSRLAIVPPVSLKARLVALLSDYNKITAGAETDEGLCSVWPTQCAGLIWLHAALASRASLGATGWSLPYVWTFADLKHSLSILKLVDNDLDLRYGDAADIVSFLGFGAQFSSRHDRLALEVLTTECVSPEGPLQVWLRILAGSSLDRLPAVAGMEELVAFSQVSLPVDDGSAYPSYLPSSCGLGLALADVNANLQNQEAEDLLKLLNGSFWEEEPVSEAGVASSAWQREAELLNHIEMLQSSLVESSERLTVFTKVKRRLSQTRSVKENRGRSTLKQDGPYVVSRLTEEKRFQKTLRRELHRLSQHLTLALESLAELADVLKGRVQSNARVQSVMDSVWQDEVPAVWKSAEPGLDCVGMSLGTWAEEMIGRSLFLHDWGQGRDPISFWLGGLVCPRDLLTGILQRHALRTEADLDTLCLVTRVTAHQAPADPWCLGSELQTALAPNNQKHPTEDVFVHGLALVGAFWDHSQDDAANTGSRVCAGISDAPQLEAPSWISLLQLIPQQSGTGPSSTAIYRCPVYRRRCRASCPLLELDLPSREAVSDAGHWAAEMARRGVALVCEVHRSSHDLSKNDAGSNHAGSNHDHE